MTIHNFKLVCLQHIITLDYSCKSTSINNNYMQSIKQTDDRSATNFSLKYYLKKTN